MGSLGTGVHFIKLYQSSELSLLKRRLKKAIERDVLEFCLNEANRARRTWFAVDKFERERIALHIGGPGRIVSERVVANALSAISRPVEKGGAELMVRYGRGRYRLNPVHFFIGTERARDKAIESYRKVRAERDAKAKAACLGEKNRAEAAEQEAAERAWRSAVAANEDELALRDEARRSTS